MLKITIKILISLLLFQLFANQVVFAQQRDDLTRELQRLEREIERVSSVVALFNHDKATELVSRAKQLHAEAVDDAQNKRFPAAELKIKAAFALLERAIKIAIDTFTGHVNRQRSKLLELLRNADYLISKSKNREAERLLNQAKKDRDAAEEAVIARKYARALNHFGVAITRAEQAIKLLKNSSSNPTDATDVILDEKRKYENLLERAREIIENSENSQAKQTYQNALSYARDAENSYRNGRIVLARKLFNQSILLLLRAMDLASATTPAATEQTTDKFYRLRDMISQSRDEILQSNRPRAKLLFDRAVNLLNEAESAARAGRNQEAIWKVELAETLLRRAQRIIQSQPNEQLSDKITQEIANTKSDIATLRGEIDADAPMDGQILLRMAEFAITKAEQAANAGLNRVALEGVLAAQRFLTRAETVMEVKDEPATDSAALEANIDRLNAALSEAEDRILTEGDDWNRQLLDSAKEIRDIAVTSYQQGNFKAAQEGIQVSFDLLRKSLKNVP